MAYIEFQYKGTTITIQAKGDEKISEICNKFESKAEVDTTNLSYLYSGTTLIPDLTLSQTISNYDKDRKKMMVMVIDNEPQTNVENLIKSPNLICPICKETALYEVQDHNIKIYNCKNGHITENLLLSEFENTQIIDESKIICDKCKTNNKSNTYNKEMYYCSSCHMNLCPLCKSGHVKNHKIIDYENKYYICDKHGKEYNSYCEDCKKDICFLCENEHEKHKIISYSKLIPKADVDVIRSIIPLTINAFNVKLHMIIDRLNNILINYEKYFQTMERILDSYNINNINYNILNNVNNIVNLFHQEISNEIFKDVQKFVADNKLDDFIPKMLNIYNKLNKNEIDLVYNIPNNRKNLKIFGEEFVENNKYLCKIIHENNEYDLTDYFEIKNNKSNKLKFKLKGINNVTDLCGMFRDCSNLSEESDFSNWDTRYVVTMAEFFYNCKFEKIPDISNFDTRNVVDMNYLFGYCSSLKSLPDISKWNTSKVSYMLKMFVECSSLKYLPEIEKWDLTNVKKLKETESMFEDCKSLKIPDKFLEFK